MTQNNNKCLLKHICRKFPNCELLDIKPIKSYNQSCDYFTPTYIKLKKPKNKLY